MDKRRTTQEPLFSLQRNKTGNRSDMFIVDIEMLENLKIYLKNQPDVEGFPQGSQDNILNLSLPPFYTACPNPFLAAFVVSHSGNNNDKDAHITGPFTDDISEGKNAPIYFAHYYSTKVPPDAIIPYILHYTKPGDLVFDGFCGTGMTGVAAQLCGDRRYVSGREGMVGRRFAILIDLSAAATFIAAGTNALDKITPYLRDIENIVYEVEAKHADLISTRHVGWPRGTGNPEKRVNVAKPHGPEAGHIEYVVWSDVFTCSNCGTEIVFWDLVFRGPGKTMPKTSPCPSCDVEQSINTLERRWVTRYDLELGQTVRQAKLVPVLINYSVGTSRFEKTPDLHDIAIIARIEDQPLPSTPPIVRMPEGFNTAQPLKSHGFSHVHHFFSRRNLVLLVELWSRIQQIDDPYKRMAGLYLLTGMIQRVCRLNRYMPNHDRHVGPLSGTLYVSQITAEIPATNYAYSRIKDLLRCVDSSNGKGVIISTQSATSLSEIKNNIVDYIFTDPPFGGNLNYSELNTLVEAWIEVYTNATSEAVVNETQRKSLMDYQKLMERSFTEFHRILRPGRWMTVEFHNSQNAVWTSIQEALTHAGFVVADVRTLDKKKGTTKQLSYSAAVKQDLIISAYKPNGGLEERFKLAAGTEDGVWDFLRVHLKQLPVFVSRDGRAEVIAERQNYLLFDRMVAFHVQRGFTVPLSAAEFYAGLAQRFSERDGMYFLPEQVAEYDKKRLTVQEILQLELFVIDESSAIQWLRQQIIAKPQTFQDLHPQFLREIGGWQKHEKPLELSELLEDNFIRYDGKGEVPGQIHSYLSSNFKELRNLPKDDPALRAKAKDRWYVPDPNKATDLERLRDRRLMKEFQEYRESKQKKLKVFRLEAVRAGFKKAWQERDYPTIIEVARKIPETILQEDPKLLMWYDQAVTRMGTEG